MLNILGPLYDFPRALNINIQNVVVNIIMVLDNTSENNYKFNDGGPLLMNNVCEVCC